MCPTMLISAYVVGIVPIFRAVLPRGHPSQTQMAPATNRYAAGRRMPLVLTHDKAGFLQTLEKRNVRFLECCGQISDSVKLASQAGFCPDASKRPGFASVTVPPRNRGGIPHSVRLGHLAAHGRDHIRYSCGVARRHDVGAGDARYGRQFLDHLDADAAALGSGIGG